MEYQREKGERGGRERGKEGESECLACPPGHMQNE